MPKNTIQKWKIIKSATVFNHRWYKVGRYTFKIASGEIIDDYFLGIFPNIAYVAAFTKEKKLIPVDHYKIYFVDENGTV